MPQLKIFVGLPALDNVARELGVDRNIMRRASVLRAFEQGSRELLAYERRAFINRRSPPLSPNTIKLKKRKRLASQEEIDNSGGWLYRIKAQPHWILRENDEILDAIEAEKSHSGKRGYHVGILNDRNHSNFNYAGGTVGTLAHIHHDRWPIVKQPPKAVMKKIQQPIIDAIHKEIRQNERKNARSVPPPRR